MAKRRPELPRACCGKKRHRSLTCEHCGMTGLVRTPGGRLVTVGASGLCTEGIDHLCPVLAARERESAPDAGSAAAEAADDEALVTDAVVAEAEAAVAADAGAAVAAEAPAPVAAEVPDEADDEDAEADGDALVGAVAADGRIRLPLRVLEILKVSGGGEVRYVIEGGDVRLVPVQPVHRLFGALQYEGPPLAIEDMRRARAAEANAS